MDKQKKIEKTQIHFTENMCRSCDEGKINDILKNQSVKEGFDQLIDGIENQLKND